MNTKPYPDPPFASCAKSGERVASESEGAAAVDVSEPQASASPVFRSHLKYIEIPPDLLAEMKVRPLARMPTSELYSTRRFEVSPKGETPALAEETEAVSSPVPAESTEGQEPGPVATAQPSSVQARSPKGSLRLGAAILFGGLLLGGYWVAAGQETEGTQDDASHTARAAAPPSPRPSGPDEEAAATESTPSAVTRDAPKPAASEAPPLERPSKPRASGVPFAEGSGAASAPRRPGESSAEGEPKASSPKKPRKWFDLE